MPKPLQTGTSLILDQLQRSSVALQVAVYEFRAAQIDDTEAMKGIEAAVKVTERMTRALRKTF